MIKDIPKLIFNVILTIFAIPFILMGCIGLILLFLSDSFKNNDDDDDIYLSGPYRGSPKL
jgi:hypothetical protein